jgi:hypothetical protein
MSTRSSFRSRRVALGVAALIGSALIGSLAPHDAGAAAACRSDPIVALSNGAQVTLYEDISDTAADVTSITYQLHIPVGLTVKSIVYQGAVPSSVQSITVHADENTGNYDAYTVVNTRTPNIPVTAYMSGTTNGTTGVSCHTNGHSGQLLHSHLHLT